MKYLFILKTLMNEIKLNISMIFGKCLTKPLEISIQPNKRCNARCLMCDFWKEKEDKLTSQEIISTISSLKDWVGKGFFLQIAGGEPLIFKGIFDIFSFCAENDIICKISTNGYALTKNVCDKIIKSKLSYLSVSLDSHQKEIHDKFRGVDGILDRAVDGIKYLAQNTKITLGVSSVLMGENVKKFPESVEFFLTLPIHRVLIQPIGVWTENLPIDRWNEYKYWVNDEEAMDILVQYLSSKKKVDSRILNTERDFVEWKEYFLHPASSLNTQIKKCKIGYQKLGIDYEGNVYPGCGSFGSIGNIKNDSLKDIWTSQKAKNIRKKMLKCGMPCQYNCTKTLSLKDKISKAAVLIRSGLFSKK
jgi:MoaA/NifB/PqqE/SkfB family radical SAM enzyme